MYIPRRSNWKVLAAQHNRLKAISSIVTSDRYIISRSLGTYQVKINSYTAFLPVSYVIPNHLTTNTVLHSLLSKMIQR